MRKPQVVPDEDHEVIYERVAAVDVAKASGVVCLRTPDPKRAGRFVNRIWDDVPATRARIAELGAELVRHRVQMVTLESTSVIWGQRPGFLLSSQLSPSRTRPSKMQRRRGVVRYSIGASARPLTARRQGRSAIGRVEPT